MSSILCIQVSVSVDLKFQVSVSVDLKFEVSVSVDIKVQVSVSVENLVSVHLYYYFLRGGHRSECFHEVHGVNCVKHICTCGKTHGVCIYMHAG